MLKGAIYARSSLGKEKQGDTVEHQIELIKEFALRSKIDVEFYNKYIYEDDGESGYKTTLLQRPSMKRLMEDIDTENVDIVFFKGISRFARDSGEAITTAKRLKNKGVRVVSIEENYDSSKDDPTMFQIYAVMAEQESRKTGVRVSLGNKQKARQGLWANSKTPLGYTKVKDVKDIELKEKLIKEGKHPHSLYPDEYSEVVKLIFNMYVKQGFGRKKITNYLNDNGYRTELNNLFNDKYIKNILINPVYIGDIVYGKKRYEYVENELKSQKEQKTVQIDEKEWAVCKNAHPPIIERDTFSKVQDIMRTRNNRSTKAQFNRAKHPLTGLLICGKCNKAMICQKRTNKKKDGTSKEYRYYVCSTHHRMGKSVCNQPNINADSLEEAILKFAMNDIKRLNASNVFNKIKIKNDIEDCKRQLKLLDGNIEKKVQSVKKLMENMDLYDQDTFKMLNKDINEEIRQLRTQKENVLEKMEGIKNRESVGEELNILYKSFIESRANSIENLKQLFHSLFTIVTVVEKDVERITKRYRF